MITVKNLSKRYGAYTAVNSASFQAEPGMVTGFLGPNGAGKSTAMRMMTGLTPPTSGRCTVLGVPYASLPNPGRHVGVLLDASAQHVGRIGREALRLMGLYLERAVKDARDDEAREQLMWASTLAGIAFGNAGVHAPHGMAYAVAGLVRDLLSDSAAARRKVSLRATDDRIDVSAIARALGGGGHRRAAGFSTDLEFPELVAVLREHLAAQL